MATLNEILDFLDKGGGSIQTKGLPNLQNEQIYNFSVQMSSGRWEVYLPDGEWVGRDQNGWPSFPEQGILLDRFTKNSMPSQGAWYFDKRSDFDAFILDITTYIITLRNN